MKRREGNRDEIRSLDIGYWDRMKRWYVAWTSGSDGLFHIFL